MAPDVRVGVDLLALPPGATITFTLFGLGMILSEAIDMDLSRWPVAARAAVNVGYVAGCVAVMLVLVVSLIGT